MDKRVSATLDLALPQAFSGTLTKKIPLGLQLYSVRNECEDNVAGTLETVSNIGFKGVEFAGYYGLSAKELRKMLDDNGLVACGTHIYLESLQGAKFRETVDFNHIIGNKFLIIRWLDGKSKQDWLDYAQAVNKIANNLKAEGMFVGYHAHPHDFKKFDGEFAWDLFGQTTSEVIMQLDTGNCYEGGADPVAVLKKYVGRTRSIHLKAFGGRPEAVIGEDKVNWEKVFTCCEKEGATEWYILEHKSGKKPLEALKRSYDALKQMGKVD